MKYVLLIDFGSTYTKLTAIDVENQVFLGNAKAITTVETDINVGYQHALDQLHAQIGPIQYDKKIACSSAAGGLKMAAIGLVQELTVEAAKRVCFGAGGKVELVFSHFMTVSDVQAIRDKKIDIILLAGGTDGGNRDSVIHNATILGKGNIKTPIIYAGNKACQDEIQAIFEQYQLNGSICENVMPRLNVLNIEPARDIIRTLFMKNIIEAKGINKLQTEIDATILPTPHAVLLASELLSKGYLHNPGLGDIVMVDIGGATTDVYSMGTGTPKRADVILKGLEEPYAKRTVEGDLGMRYSAVGVLATLSEEAQKGYLEQGIDIKKEAIYRCMHIDMIPKTEHEEAIDIIFGQICSDNALSRHVGKMESVYTPLGMMYYQYGKDLSDVAVVIGTGGVVIYNSKPKDILNKVCYNTQKPLELRPKAPTFMIDANYIFSAMGLLSLYEPECALKLMKENLKIV